MSRETLCRPITCQWKVTSPVNNRFWPISLQYKGKLTSHPATNHGTKIVLTLPGNFSSIPVTCYSISVHFGIQVGWRNSRGHRGILMACSRLPSIVFPGSVLCHQILKFIDFQREILPNFEYLSDFLGPTVLQIRPHNTSSKHSLVWHG